MNSIFKHLSYDDSSDEEIVNPCIQTYYNTLEDKFNEQDIDNLYHYFHDYGKNIWKIERCNIVASLRRNNGDLNNTGKELEHMIHEKYQDFNIKYFYKIDNGEEKQQMEHYNNIPYLSDQEWQMNLIKNTYLFYDDDVYMYIRKYDQTFTIHHILYNEYSYISFVDKCVISGKIKEIKKENIDTYLKINIEKIRKKYDSKIDDLQKEKTEYWSKKRFCVTNVMIL